MAKGFPHGPMGGMPAGPPAQGQPVAMQMVQPLNDIQLVCLMAAEVHAAVPIDERDDSVAIRTSTIIALELFGNAVVLMKETGAVGLITESIRKREGLLPDATDDEAEEIKRKAARAAREAENGLKLVEGEQGV